MDTTRKEDREKFSQLYMDLYSLYLISDELYQYCEPIFSLQEKLTDSYYSDEAIEHQIDNVLSVIDENYTKVIIVLQKMK